MQVRDLMTSEPACCSPETRLEDVARLMVEHDCGEIPVVNEAGRPVGVVTDRDIACRAVARGKGHDIAAREVMSSPVVTVTPDTSLEECCQVLEDNQIRRVPVVDHQGVCCGMVSQADIALHAAQHSARVLQDVSQPSTQPSRVRTDH